jgi:Cu(I)/Ag(I) efflux system protein CusF
VGGNAWHEKDGDNLNWHTYFNVVLHPWCLKFEKEKGMKTLMMVLALTGTFAVAAAEMSGGKKEGANSGGQPAAAAVSRATGVVKGMDAAAGRVIISHEPIPALKWPAMTMSFRITPELAKGLKVDQKVEFEFQAKDMDGTITKVKVLPQ